MGAVAPAAYVPSILHVGCGGASLPDGLSGYETRLDASPAGNPDIVASMTDLGDIGTYDAIYCAHALEHLDPIEVNQALAEFVRVLRPGGLVIVRVPDLTDVRPTFDVVYESPCGPITGHDMYFGHTGMAHADPLMRHRIAFTNETIRAAFVQAGLVDVKVERHREFVELWATGAKA